MKKFFITTVFGLALLASQAYAAATWLDCHASGGAGEMSFRFGFDEGANQASTSWASGGGHPWHPTATFTETTSNVSISLASVGATFQPQGPAGGYTYFVFANRTNGTVSFSYQHGDRPFESVGSCQVSQGQGTLF